MRTIFLVEAIVGAGAALAFVIGYARAGWWRSEVGRHLMSMTALLGALLGLIVIGRAFGPLPQGVWAVGMGTLDILLVRRVFLMIKARHAERRTKNREQIP